METGMCPCVLRPWSSLPFLGLSTPHPWAHTMLWSWQAQQTWSQHGLCLSWAALLALP